MRTEERLHNLLTTSITSAHRSATTEYNVHRMPPLQGTPQQIDNVLGRLVDGVVRNNGAVVFAEHSPDGRNANYNYETGQITLYGPHEPWTRAYLLMHEFGHMLAPPDKTTGLMGYGFFTTAYAKEEISTELANFAVFEHFGIDSWATNLRYLSWWAPRIAYRPGHLEDALHGALERIPRMVRQLEYGMAA